MAVMISVTLGGVPIDVADELGARLGTVGEAGPTGLVAHCVQPVEEDALRIIDIWMSEADHDAFDDATDPPAVLRSILEEHGLAPPRFISRELVEVHNVICGPISMD